MYMFKEDIKNVIIFHHNDMDGYVGAKAISEAIKYYAPHMLMPRFVECSYSNNKWKHIIHTEELKNTMICIVDFSFPMEEMEYLCEKVGRQQVVWLDHHVGIINKYIENWGTRLSTIPGLRISTGLSGAELAYLYFNAVIAQPISSKNILVIDNKEYHTDNKMDRDALIAQYLTPGLKLVGDWDTFRHTETPNDRSAIAMNYYFNAKEHKTLTEKFYMMYFQKGISPELMCAINEGKIIDVHEIRKNANNVKNNAFECIINGFSEIHAVALNFSGQGSSMLYESIRDKYEVGIVYSFNGKQNVYSFYRLGEHPEKIINCAKIAATFGGGGHMSAAGVCVDKDKEVIRIATPKKKRRKPMSYVAREVENIEELLQCSNVLPGECVFVKDASDDRRARGIDDNPLDSIAVGAVYVRTHGGYESYRDLEWGWSICGVTNLRDEIYES